EEHGTTVILTSHYMEDVAALCPRVIAIDHGQLAWDGALEALVHQIRPEKRITLKLASEVPVETRDLAGARLLSQRGIELRLQVGQAELPDTVAALLSRLKVVDLTVEDPPLEEVLSELFARSAL
ncbi:MAG TPA: ABC transporter, partial [Polyangiales bacterium]